MNTHVSRKSGMLVAAFAGALFGLPASQTAGPATTVATANPDIAPREISSPAVGNDTLILSAAPRDNASDWQAQFAPLARYLSQVLGRRVVTKFPGTWGGYEADMQRGIYDIVFDGPHFVDWRIEKTGHTVLVRFPGKFIYTAVVRRDEPKFTSLSSLAGHTFCAHPPPNLGTMIMFSEFDNPVRQPAVVVIDGYKEIYDALIAGKCDAAMLPLKHVEKFDPNGQHTRIIFQSNPMPQQALTVGPRLSEAEREKVRQALLSPAANAALARVRTDYGLGQDFVPASNQEFAGLGKYLTDIRGF